MAASLMLIKKIVDLAHEYRYILNVSDKQGFIKSGDNIIIFRFPEPQLCTDALLRKLQSCPNIHYGELTHKNHKEWFIYV